MASADLNTTVLASVLSGRHVAVDVRPRSVGFVVIEDGTVIDSGIRVCDQSQFEDCLGGRFDRILHLYRPSVVILKSSRIPGSDWKKRRVLAAIKRGARRHTSSLKSVTPTAIRGYFLRHNARTKYQIAEIVATLMPELAWKLPRKRKPWQSEHYRMSIFDAAAIAITFLESQHSPEGE